MKHSKGPWERHETADGTWHIIGGGRVVARCDTFEPGSPQMAADARLIAAAPLMLEALENLENDSRCMPASAWELVQKAVEAATGRRKP